MQFTQQTVCDTDHEEGGGEGIGHLGLLYRRTWDAGLCYCTLRSALEELVAASLLDAGCAQGRLLYSIHRLTEYFILSDLIGVEPPGPLT